jgi:hypothetical protein
MDWAHWWSVLLGFFGAIGVFLIGYIAKQILDRAITPVVINWLAWTGRDLIDRYTRWKRLPARWRKRRSERRAAQEKRLLISFAKSSSDARHLTMKLNDLLANMAFGLAFSLL